MTLYLKYRPRNLDELDIISVKNSLKNIFHSKNIPHAFLFAGPKGTGKTSAARIIAKMINCESKNPPCDKCNNCISIAKGTNIDVIELDAASHRGIDDIRELREAVKLAPAVSKKKIYTIDEAHMLTAEASNALLKTLEEPPAHVFFVLATTNPEKLISTIRSRATLVSFGKATDDEITASLKRVAKGENIKMSPEALKIIARSSGGSFRDAVKILEQIFLEGVKLDETSIEKFLFRVKESDLTPLFSFLKEKNFQKSLSEARKILDVGTSTENLIAASLSSLRKMLLSKYGIGEKEVSVFSLDETLKLIDLFIWANGILDQTPIEELAFEMAIFKFCKGEEDEENKKNDSLKEAPGSLSDTDEKKSFVKLSALSQKEKDKNNPRKDYGQESVSDEGWKEILSKIKPINASVEALLRASRPVGFDGERLTLGVFYKFHKEKLEENNHRKVVEIVAGEVLGRPIRVNCVLTEAPVIKPFASQEKKKEEEKESTVLTEGADNDIIKAAEEIFGV